MSTDPLQNAVYDGIKRSIQVCLDNDCYAAAVILIYSGIDTMATLGMAANQQDVTRNDFVDWCDRYLKLTGQTKISGLEWYAARCGVLHNYSARSRLSRAGQARHIGYVDDSLPAIVFNPAIDPSLVMISVKALAVAFFAGIDNSLIHVFADKERRAIGESRLQWMFNCKPFQPSQTSADGTSAAS